MTLITKSRDFDLRTDVIPVALARPILTPPRSMNDPIDPPLFAFRDPYDGTTIRLIDEQITLWGDCYDGPVILKRGQELFVGWNAHCFTTG